jgi:hypothetical protein
VVIGLLLAGLLGACSLVAPRAGTQPSPTPTTRTDTRTERAQRLVDDIVTAGRRGDSTAEFVSSRDQVFAGRAAVWSANLARIDWTSLRWTVRSAQASRSDARRAVLGPDAWVQSVTLSWALPDESRTAEEEVWLTFVDEPAVAGGAPTLRLAGDTDGPGAGSPAPIWWQQPVHLRRDGATVLLTDDDDPDWLEQASAARRAVRKRIGVAERDKDGPLVVELPRSRAAFERALGVPATSYAQVAAAAWPMGADTSTAPIHVVVNPEATARLSALGRNVMLTHEAVHVATRSPGSPAPTWLVEGYADRIAYRAHPSGAVPATEAVRDAVRRDGVPRDWPVEDDFGPEAADLDLTYDLAWTATRSIAMAYGDDALNRFYAAVDGGASLEEAAEKIGTTKRALRQRWRADLTELAAR